jgi:hypothetical protein
MGGLHLGHGLFIGIVFVESEGVPGAVPHLSAQWFFRQQGAGRPAGGVVELLVVIAGFAQGFGFDMPLLIS